VSSSAFTEATEWGGRPVARKISETVPRGRIVITGRISEVATIRVGHASSYRCLLDDGTGQIGLIFVGRNTLPGLVPGIRCTVEGTVIEEASSFVLWNPLYRLEIDEDPTTAPRRSGLGGR
jgi:hypothetical protein